MVYIFRSLAAIVTHIQKKNMYYFMNIERNVNLFSFLMKKKNGTTAEKKSQIGLSGPGSCYDTQFVLHAKLWFPFECARNTNFSHGTSKSAIQNG